MYIEKIEWIDKEGKEAILKVVNQKKSLICFSCPCSYNVGDVLTKPLECLDTDDIVLCETMGNNIEKLEGAFAYKLKGELKDVEKGIINICGFKLHIDKERIPGDITNGMCVQFVTARIDIW